MKPAATMLAVFAAVIPALARAAEIPDLALGLNPFRVREIAHAGGWQVPAEPRCKPSGDISDDEFLCALPFTEQYLRRLPETIAAAADRPYVATCYNDGKGHSLIVSFEYPGDEKGASERIEKYRRIGWRIEFQSCERGMMPSSRGRL